MMNTVPSKVQNKRNAPTTKGFSGTFGGDIPTATVDLSGITPAFPQEDTVASTALHNGIFVLPVYCPPIMQEGFYVVEIKLGCRDIRCGEWVLPTTVPLRMMLRVEG